MMNSSLSPPFGYVVSCALLASLLLLVLSCHAESTTSSVSLSQHAMMDHRHVVETASDRLRAQKLRQQQGPLALNIRGGGSSNKEKKTVPTSTKKSPLGLPAFVGPALYGNLDVIPFIFHFAYFASVLEGTARQFYTVAGIFHTLLGLVTNYDGRSGSILQRYLKVNVGVSMSIMYWCDIMFAIIFLLLPSYIDGYTDEKVTLMIRASAMSGLLFFFPFAAIGEN